MKIANIDITKQLSDKQLRKVAFTLAIDQLKLLREDPEMDESIQVEYLALLNQFTVYSRRYSPSAKTVDVE